MQQNQDGQGFVQYNSFNLYDNQLISSFQKNQSLQGGQANEVIVNHIHNPKNKSQIPLAPQIPGVKRPDSKGYGGSAKKQESRKLQAHDKIPVGLQGVMNK